MRRAATAPEPLVCPRCASTQPLHERFCPDCRMPLVYAGATGVDQPVTARHERARKVKPQYSEGDLVRVAGARNQAEAELIQGLLLEEGVPSSVRRSAGFDVPDFLAAGPRDVLVPASGAPVAREMLLSDDPEREPSAASIPVSPQRLLIWLLAAVAVAALAVWLGTSVL